MKLHAPSQPVGRSAQSARAFTLVEILIAMGILGLVLTAIYSTWTAILRASKVGQDAAAAVQRARMAANVIEQSLGSTVCFVGNQYLYSFVSENGSEPVLEFTARLPKSFPRSGRYGAFDVRRVQFSLQSSSENGNQLVLRQTPLLMEMDEDEKNFPLVLAKHVKQFKTEFWDTRAQDWIDEWKQTNQLPTLVKVTLKLADNAHSSVAREAVTRIVSLPAVAVQPPWQMPMQPGTPGAQGNQPLTNPVGPANNKPFGPQ